MSLRSLCLVVLAALGSFSCAGEDSHAGEVAASELNAEGGRAAVTARGLARLAAIRSSPPLARYYEGGRESTRVRACWKNPAASKLSELQKAFYCSVPLEVRLCTSPQLLRGRERPLEERLQGFRRCQRRAIDMLGDAVDMGEDVADLFFNILLRQRSGLSAADEAAFIDAERPTEGGFFPVLLVGTVVSLTAEARELNLDLAELVGDGRLEEDPSDI